MTLSKKGFANMAKEIKLTQESLDAYKDELEYLKTTRADEPLIGTPTPVPT